MTIHIDENMESFIPINFWQRGDRRVAADQRYVHDVTLLEGLAKAFYWQDLLMTGTMKSGSAIARAEGVHHSVINELLRLTLLAPDIIDRMLKGQQPRTLTLMWFQRNPLPVEWTAQRSIMERFEMNA
jgi:hypothetical protein